MKKSSVILLIVLGLFYSCGKSDNDKIVRGVKLLEITNSDNVKNIDFNGVVVPQKESMLAFKVMGDIEKILVSKGSKVSQGEVLVELNSRDYKLALQVAEKKYEAAKENYDARLASAENSKLQFQRVEKLYKEKATTKKSYDEMKAKNMADTAMKNAAYAQKEEALKGVLNAKNRLEDTFLRAPYEGYISNKILDDGAVVNPGMPVLSLSSMDAPEVNISISDKEQDIFENENSIVFLYNNIKYPLEIKEISKKPDVSNLSYSVSLKFMENINILSGTSGKVIVTVENTDKKDIKIPLTAIFEDNGTKVWIYKDGAVTSKNIEIEKLDENGFVIVKSGLAIGQEVVTAGVNFLHEGELVKPIPQTSKTNVGKLF